MKIITNISFYLAIIATIVLLLASTFYVVPDTGKEYTLFDIIFGVADDKVVTESGLVSEEIIIKGINSHYYEMFLPLVTVIPFIVGIYGDKKNSITRFQIYRTGKLRYTLGKFMAVLVSGGLITMLGQMIFSLIIYSIFPHGESEMFELNKIILFEESEFCKVLVDRIGIMGLYILRFLRVFLYGAFSTVIAFALSIVIKNRYMVLTIPVVIEYMWEKFISKSIDAKMYTLLPSSIGNVFHTDISWMLPFFITIIVVSLVFYRVCLERKCDCGEE